MTTDNTEPHLQPEPNPQAVHPAFAARPPREPWINPAKHRAAAALAAAALVLALVLGAVLGAALSDGHDRRGGHGRAFARYWVDGRPLPPGLRHHRLHPGFRIPGHPDRSPSRRTPPTAPPTAPPSVSPSTSPTPSSSHS